MFNMLLVSLTECPSYLSNIIIIISLNIRAQTEDPIFGLISLVEK